MAYFHSKEHKIIYSEECLVLVHIIKCQGIQKYWTNLNLIMWTNLKKKERKKKCSSEEGQTGLACIKEGTS